ncbi:MAG: hypothetical protein GPJ51_01855 [Candidatus Heimdallarchaeota archaeon]|nr:hypothetical protein [Candidatus Heimdallarchaeota archaeon]
MSDPREIRMKLEREDTPTHSVWKRWKYELFVKHLKKTVIYFTVFCVAFVICFFITWAIMGLENWYYGFAGIFILLFYIVKWVGLGIAFITVRAYIAYFFAPVIYLIIKYFIHVDRVGLRELGSGYTYFFKITTTSEGYLLHEDKFLGLSKTPVYLDKVTLQYFKDFGTERISKEKGKKDDTYLEVDIVPLSWRGDSLLITNEETKKKFINNKILVTEPIRDYYSLVVKGFSPADRESEKGIIYDKILGTADLKQQVIQLKREIKEMDIEHIEKVAEVLIPHSSDELRRFKNILRETTKPYDKLSESIEQKTSILKMLQEREESLTDQELAKFVAIEELD